ncbi:hypothetical protein ES702_01191 [subsurface metagenome]
MTKLTKYDVESMKWTKQAMDMTPLNSGTPIYGLTKKTQDLESESFGIFYLYHKPGEDEIYFSQDRIDKLGDLYLKRKSNIDNYYQNWLKVFNKIKQKSRQIRDLYLKKLSLEELEEQWNQLCQVFLEGWTKSGFVEVYDNTSNQIINRSVRKAKLKKQISENDRTIFLEPGELAIVQQERISFLKILEQIQKKYKKFNKSKILKDKKINRLIENHVNQFYFITADYSKADELTKEHFLKRIKIEIEKPRVKKELPELNKVVKHVQELPKLKKAIENKYNLPEELKEIFHYFSLLAKWRDQRKKMHQIGAVSLEKIVLEAAKRNSVPKDLIRYFIFSDFRGGFSNLQKLIPQLKKRGGESMFMIDDLGSIVWSFGKNARQIKAGLDKTFEISKEDIITGATACKGKVSGTVKIIKSVEAFGKFNHEDVLVTSMTRVEFMPVVRKAAAIVTDEGGITCHAAIVSRELNIPCIIGTKVATKTLKDGDEVEVDADKGEVKILKKAK